MEHAQLLPEAFEITGDWRLTVRAGRFADALRIYEIAEQREITVAPPCALPVVAERHDSLPLHNPNAGFWRRGALLHYARCQETAAEHGLVPDSVSVSLDQAGTQPLSRGVDYDYGEDWACIWRLPDGGLADDTPVYVSYTAQLPRIDAIMRDYQGGIRYAPGDPSQILPVSPEPSFGESVIARLWIHRGLARLLPESIFPVMEDAGEAYAKIAVPPDRAMARLPKTLQKLRNGERLRILAWGDSVTDGNYLTRGPSDRWQERLVRQLRSRVPDAQIELITTAWGGRNCRHFINEPPGSIHNYQEQVLDQRPDLIISEFINDTGLPYAELETLYPRFLADFQTIGAEWIILTPHYSRPSMMGFPHERDCDSDPRELLRFLCDFSRHHDVPLANAAGLWGHLWRRGIPYRSLLANDINHPDTVGMDLFVEALLPWFPSAD